MTKVYKLRHKPTGLFYKPLTQSYPRNNLSPTGKLYEHRKPTLKNLGKSIYVNPKQHKGVILKESNVHRNTRMLTVYKEDWEIVEYELREIKLQDM